MYLLYCTFTKDSNFGELHTQEEFSSKDEAEEVLSVYRWFTDCTVKAEIQFLGDKELVNDSKIDGLVKLCRERGLPFRLDILGQVVACDGESYQLRRLEVADSVYLEQIQTVDNPNFEDVLTMVKFKLSEEPKDWKLEI